MYGSQWQSFPTSFFSLFSRFPKYQTKGYTKYFKASHRNPFCSVPGTGIWDVALRRLLEPERHLSNSRTDRVRGTFILLKGKWNCQRHGIDWQNFKRKLVCVFRNALTCDHSLQREIKLKEGKEKSSLWKTHKCKARNHRESGRPTGQLSAM